MRKLFFLGQIVVIHLWFIFSAYTLLTEEKQTYLGIEEDKGISTNEYIFYASLLILVFYYLFFFLKKNKSAKK